MLEGVFSIGLALRVGFGPLRVNGQALELQKPIWALAPILEIGVVLTP